MFPFMCTYVYCLAVRYIFAWQHRRDYVKIRDVICGANLKYKSHLRNPILISDTLYDGIIFSRSFEPDIFICEIVIKYFFFNITELYRKFQRN